MVSYLTPHCAISRITQGVWKIRRIHLLSSSAKPQLPAAAKLAELQPNFAFHPPPPPPPPPPVPVDSKLQLGEASSSNHSWISKQPKPVGS